MKTFASKMKKIDLVHGYRFCRLLRLPLYGFLCICAGSYLTSCATKGPAGTYLESTSLSRISKVAIVASVSDPKVSFARTELSTENLFLLVGPVDLIPMVVEGAIRTGADRGHTGKVRERVDLSHLEEKVAQSFMQQLQRDGCFQTIEYLTVKNQDIRQLSAKGYDAAIRLLVREISLNRTGGDQVRIDVYVRGEMESFSSGKVVWDREEHVLSPERRPLNYYKENGLKELDAMPEKAGRNLAYDFVYLK